MKYGITFNIYPFTHSHIQAVNLRRASVEIAVPDVVIKLVCIIVREMHHSRFKKIVNEKVE